MNNKKVFILYLISLTMGVLAACQRREIYDVDQDTLEIPITLDWSESKITSMASVNAFSI